MARCDIVSVGCGSAARVKGNHCLLVLRERSGKDVLLWPVAELGPHRAVDGPVDSEVEGEELTIVDVVGVSTEDIESGVCAGKGRSRDRQGRSWCL